jgi:hypothetical protein
MMMLCQFYLFEFFSLSGFTTKDNYRKAHAEAKEEEKLGHVIYLQLSADGWNRSSFGKKGMAGIYASILSLPADVRFKEFFVVCNSVSLVKN